MNRSPFLTAVFHPINLAMLALTVFAGLVSAWWLAPIGFIFWIIMVIVVARDPGLQLTFTRQNRQPLAQRYQVRFDRLERARFSIFNAMAQAGAKLRNTVLPVQDSLDELVDDCYQLSLRMSALDNHYAVQNISNDFDADIKKLEGKLAGTSDEAAKKEYADTIASLKTRKEQMKSLAAVLDRFEAQVTGTSNAVDGVVTSVVSLKGRSPDQAKEKVPALLEILQTEKNEFKQFSEAIQEFSFV
jgi:acyl-CoA-binding protein